MTIEEAMTQLLLADSAFVAEIGGSSNPRLYPQDAPQDGALPQVLYVTSDPEQRRSMKRFLQSFRQTFRWDCYGSRAAGAYSSAKALAAHVRRVVFGFFAGVCGGGTVYIDAVADGGGEDGLREPLYAEEDGIDYVGVLIDVHWHPVT